MSSVPIPVGLTIIARIFIILGLASAAVIVADIYLARRRKRVPSG